MSKKKLVSVAVASLLALGGSLGLATGASAVATSTTTARISGADRYETAVAVANSKVSGETSGMTFYLASGENYADALPGGVLAAAANSVLLLVKPNEIPAVVKAYIEKVDTANANYVILGGTGSVSTSVFESLNGYVGNAPSRVAGADRYETAVKISQLLVTDDELAAEETASTNNTVVFLASGEAYPDALSGAAAAIATGNVAAGTGVVLLTQAGSLPAATAAELLRLDTDKGTGATLATNNVTGVRVLGGTGSISDAVVTAVDNRIGINVSTDPDASDIRRWAGADRYATSAAVVTANLAGTFSSAAKVIVASGENYPDALAAGQISSTGANARPVLLVRAGSVDTSVCAALGNLPTATTEVIALGGTGSISNATLAAAAACLDNAAPTFSGSLTNTVQKVGSTFSLAGLTASDAEDGNLTSSITYTAKKYPFFSWNGSAFAGTGTAVASSIDMSVEAVYAVTFAVVDSKGVKTLSGPVTVAVVDAPSVSWNTTSAAIDDAVDLRDQVVAKDWNGVAFTSTADGGNTSANAIFVTAVNATTGATIAVDSNGDMADQTVGTSVTLTYVVTDPQGGLKTTFTYTGVTK